MCRGCRKASPASFQLTNCTMDPSVLALCLLPLLTGTLAQHSVTQAPSVTATPGQTVKLPCTLGGGLTVGSNCVSFVQQKHGQAPRGLLYYCSDSNKGKADGVSERFVGSGSGSVGYLTISDVRAEDDAEYYCASWTGSQFVFGGGTQLNILTGETKAPTLSIFPPSQEEVEKNKATLVCLCQDFYPASLDVTWKVGDQTITNGVEKSRATKQSENNLFMASSYLSLSTIDWSADKTVTCQVTHQGKTFEKSLKKSECF